MKFRNPKDVEGEANHLIPLINIIFVILIFFLVLYRFSTFDVSDDTKKEEEINLFNNSLSSISSRLKNTAIIEINETGKLFINGISTSNIATALKKRIDNPKETNCILRINENTPYSDFSKLMLNLKKIGVKRINFKSVSN